MMQRREFLSQVVRTAMAGGAALAAGRRVWPLTGGATGAARRASVVDFGADPTGQKDSTAAVQKAIASLARRNARLVYPAGKYTFGPAGKYTFGASDPVLMDFSSYEGLEIFGGGAELFFTGATRPLRMTGCKDLEVHDIVVDWQGTVGGAGDDIAALELNGCEQILLESVVVHSSPGAGALLRGCRDITLDTVRVIPHPGGDNKISSAGDGLEVLDCTGTVDVQHATISGAGNAGMRVQQSYWRVGQVNDPQSAVLASADGKPAPAWLLPAPGTYMQISEAGSLKLLGEIVVTKAETVSGGMRLSFAETLSPEVVKGTLFCLSATNQAQLKMDDCKFLGGPSIGLIAQSRARIANSSFRNLGGQAILLAPDVEDMRGPVVENIHINDCTFAECNLAPGDERGAITIDTQPRPTSATKGARVNEGVTIQRNVFSRLGGPAIYCAGTSWLDVESNRFEDCDRRRPAGAEPRAMVLRNLDQSTVVANQAGAAGKVVLSDCTDKVKVGDNGPLTNAIA